MTYIRILLIENERSEWTAHCLDYTIFAQGDSQQKCLDTFHLMIEAYIHHSSELGEESLAEVDRIKTPLLWMGDMFEAGEKLDDYVHRFVFLFHPRKVIVKQYKMTDAEARKHFVAKRKGE